MAHLATASIIRQIESLFDGSSVAGLTDRELLDRFTSRRDADAEVAFAGLVARHGPMVLGVCRQILGDRHHAEDAFQAVFLVLARKARSIRNPELVGSWLYGVARRTAGKLKTRLSRRRKHEEGDAMIERTAVKQVEATLPAAEVSAIACEEAEIFHREIARLPQRFRLPVVVCYFEGLSLEEAAQRLRWPGGTVASRLARARDRLRRALTRRGVALPSVALEAALSPGSARPLVSFNLGEVSTQATLRFAVGRAAGNMVPHGAGALAREALKSMMRQNVRAAALTLLLLGTIATGAAFLARLPATQNDPKKPSVPLSPPVATSSQPAAQKTAAGRMLVTGRVLDPQGKPIPNATVMVHAGTKLGRAVGTGGRKPTPIGQARIDGSGRFRIDALRTTSARDEVLSAVAVAPGFGAGWVLLDPDAEEPAAEITLRPEQVIRGRVFDVHGQPVQAVTVTVRALFRVPRLTPGFRGESEGEAFWMTQAKDLTGWPLSTTDGDGRFILRGVDRGTHLYLEVNDPRFARQRIDIDTNTLSDSKPLPLVLDPAQMITGRVTYADNGKPAAKAWVTVSSMRKMLGAGGIEDFQADAEGRFHANPFLGDQFIVVAHPPDRQPYLSIRKTIDWPKGAIQQSIDLALPRGVLIRGKVTEEGSGQPIEGAIVRYIVQSEQVTGPDLTFRCPAETSADGSFELGVVLRPGYLVIRAPSEDYANQEIGDRLLFEGQPGGRRVYGHAFIACDPKPGSPGQPVNVVLRRGVAINGRVIGPQGQAPRDTLMFSRVILGPGILGWARWIAQNRAHARDGRFELHGLDPAADNPVYFLAPNQELGATALLSGKLAGGPPVTVRLEPMGAARARLVNAEGKPIAIRLPPAFVTMVVTPGPPASRTESNSGQLFADEGSLSQVDPVNHAQALASDAAGRVKIPDLIPGATYRLIDRSAMRGAVGAQFVRKEFRVKSGETLDLGDIRIENPQSPQIR